MNSSDSLALSCSVLHCLVRLPVTQDTHRTGPSFTRHFSLLLITLVHGLLLFATVQGTRIRDSGGLLWANQMRELTSLGKEVIKGVTEVGNMVLIQRPVLPLSLAQTLHELCRGQRSVKDSSHTVIFTAKNFCLLFLNPTSSSQNQTLSFQICHQISEELHI